MTEQTNDIPAWSSELRQAYLAGAASLFILHGNVSDLAGGTEQNNYILDPLADYLSKVHFSNYDLILHYDMGRGLRPYAASDPRRYSRMNSLLSRLLGDAVQLPRDATQALRMVDRIISLLLVGEENRTIKTAVLFDYAELICPPDDRYGEHLATLLNWSRSPIIRKINLIFILMTESLSRLNPSLTQSGHPYEIQIPLPGKEARKQFIENRYPPFASDADRLAVLSSGVTLTNLDSMMRRISNENGREDDPGSTVNPKSIGSEQVHTAHSDALAKQRQVSDKQLLEIKKSLMEAQCPGLLEFIKPDYTLSLVAGHTAAKHRLTQDSQLIRNGQLDAVPMGYLLCGPVGVGKTFLAYCYAGEVGIPCVTIRNFRSKYVGETEANLERILNVVRELGPVAVIIDEADAAVGDRSASGDSGTSARVFAQLASQMGDTRYRGRIIWFLLTCRPDLLPVDIKRQGRCEEHIPLFYPQTPDELRDMFLAMSRKARISLPDSSLPDFNQFPSMSGADIEGILMRSRRESLLRNTPVDAALIHEVASTFRSVKSDEHELQTLAGVLECTDLRYLPADIRKAMSDAAGYEKYSRRYRELKALEDIEM
ncbi:MAG: AAA family ATPase [Candidatus Omnitrophica bacterium]|nr:AAA family ATPase [Candidatus Omnitrophota bacterium]